MSEKKVPSKPATNRRKARDLHKTALYAVWKNMMRAAKKDYNFYQKHGFRLGLPVDPLFVDFENFALWARLSAGYEIGASDAMGLCRRDKTKPYSPDNCYFDLHNETDDKFEITPGAKYFRNSQRDTRWFGLSKSRLYNIWKTMNRMCSDESHKDYDRYGAIGVRVCEQWRGDFLAFEDWAWEHGYTDELTLTRVDSSRGFSPKNCRWETATERRCTNLRGYEKIRLSVKRMREYLKNIDDLAICTLIISPKYTIPLNGPQDDLAPTPIYDRIDKRIGNDDKI